MVLQSCARLTSNPFQHGQIDNPEYKPDPKLHARAQDVSFVGFELWQVKAGTHFDDIIITDSIEVRRVVRWRFPLVACS